MNIKRYQDLTIAIVANVQGYFMGAGLKWTSPLSKIYKMKE
jgi:hypothetical protein